MCVHNIGKQKKVQSKLGKENWLFLATKIILFHFGARYVIKISNDMRNDASANITSRVIHRHTHSF